jgi:hypothetical protein
MNENHKKQFDQRFGAFQIPKEELDRMFQLEMRLREEMLMMAEQAGGESSSISAPGAGGSSQSSAPSGCISFGVFTGISVNFGAQVTTSDTTSFTVIWGDGAETVYTSTGAEALVISHSYSESSANYSAQICFEDPTLITELNFFGDD